MTDDRDLRGRDGRSDAEDTDEMVSAHLDGEATPAEVARIEADPALLARSAELRAVAAAVGRPVEPPPADVRDRQIEAALAAFRRPDLAPVDLGAERDLRTRHRRRLWAVSVAAALLVALIAVPLLARLTSDGDADVATMQDRESAGQAAGEDETPAAGATEPDDAAGGGPVTESAEDDGAGLLAAAVPLGSFADEDELLVAVRQAGTPPATPDATTASTLPLAPGVAACPPPAERAGQPTASYVAEVAGAPVTVYVYPSGASGSVVVLDATCEVTLESDL
jgi:hypothetical protein